ncbi:glycosyl transferase (plasmid) [Deltaproteobacteria bacterium Smac51]|nr:glycosyl transferase [Deltaproteobacteria bacterium Smac51]
MSIYAVAIFLALACFISGVYYNTLCSEDYLLSETNAEPQEHGPEIAANKVAVIIPARDEVLTIADIVARTRAYGYHVLVVDDASGDGTAMAAYKAGAEVLVLKVQRGNLRAIQAGMGWMLEHRRLKPQWLVTIDADGQHAPEDIAGLLDLAGRKPDTVVIGSCPERSSWMRQMVWAFFRRLSGLKVHDMTSGFKAYSIRAASVMCGTRAYGLAYQDVPTLLLLKREGFNIEETAVSMVPRRAGISRVFSSWGKVALYMSNVTWQCFMHRLKVLAGIK